MAQTQHNDDALRVSVLSEALPYIQRFAGRRIVVKYGGAAMAHAELRDAVFRDLALLACVGVQPVVVHGGGPEINQWLGVLKSQPNSATGSVSPMPTPWMLWRWCWWGASTSRS